MIAPRAGARLLAEAARGAARAALDRGARSGRGIRVAAGHDLVELAALAPHLRPRFLARAFTPHEVAYARSAADPLPHLGARWAAKEAAYKAICQLADALGEPSTGLASFVDYEVFQEDRVVAVPALRFHGGPAALLAAAAARGFDVSVGLSITHEQDYAAAFVVVAAIPAIGSTACIPQP